MQGDKFIQTLVGANPPELVKRVESLYSSMSDDAKKTTRSSSLSEKGEALDKRLNDLIKYDL